LELRGIGLITGEAGSGKTTVCRKVAAAVHPGLYPGERFEIVASAIDEDEQMTRERVLSQRPGPPSVAPKSPSSTKAGADAPPDADPSSGVDSRRRLRQL
jgi:type II secretory pathway predicted ATPase ExeA